MSEFLLGIAVATYVLIVIYFVSDGTVHGWTWFTVLLWPITVPLLRLLNRRV
jgi:hypothetical protein